MSDTVKGGKYVQGENFVDANGKVLGPVNPEPVNPKPEPKKPAAKKAN